jgi:transcriptional regulator with XRE-family HTH domain
MGYGYSIRLIDLNKKADKQSLGVRLGKLCIKNNIPVAEVATSFGVSRQTIYNWFIGATFPQPAFEESINEFINTLK